MQPPSVSRASPPPAPRDTAPLDLSPSILVVDDEKQIHSSLRLRLGPRCHLVCVFDPEDALQCIRRQQFDLCIVDIHMPKLDGLDFVEAARELDPALGYVILSGYDSPENLRRAIPLQVFDFIGKPIPQKGGFEARVSEWVDRTRARRREMSLAFDAGKLIQDLELARIEKDVEITASASAREALLQSAGLLTTIQALLLNAQHLLNATGQIDARSSPLARSINEARKHADTAATIAERYFTSAYADRQTSPALVDDCTQHAVSVSLRAANAEARRQRVDLQPLGRFLALSDLAGIDYVLMLVPLITQALELAAPDSTVVIHCRELARLDEVFDNGALRRYLWVNRSHAATSAPGVMISVRALAPALDPAAARSWLRGDAGATLRLPCRGLIRGVQQARGLAGVALHPEADRFAIIVCLRA
jgi:CheY-like chemotaxis protein